MKSVDRIVRHLIFILACLSSTFSISRNVNDWQVTSKWCSLLICTLLALFYISVKSFKEIRPFSRSDIHFYSAVLVSLNILLSIRCLLQLFGLLTCGSVFPAISDFDNPAGIASFLCLTIPFVIPTFNQNKESERYLLLIAILNIVVLFLIGSRTGVIAITLSIAIFVISRWKQIERDKQIIVVFVILLSILLLTYLSITKRSSTYGRKIILDVCRTMFLDSPWTGLGFHGFSKYYMNYQADYLSSINNPILLSLSDNISHPLCEYAILLVNHGLIGMTLVLSIVLTYVFISVRKDENKPFIMMLTVNLFVLSSFSYPFRYPMTLLSVITASFFIWNRFITDLANSCVCFIRGGALPSQYFLLHYIYQCLGCMLSIFGGRSQQLCFPINQVQWTREKN